MQILKIAWLFAIASIIVFASCKKENEDRLPPATQVGAGTFGCKINGKVYVPTYGKGLYAQFISSSSGKNLLIVADKYVPSERQGPNMGLSITLESINSPKSFTVPVDALFTIIPYRGFNEKYIFSVCDTYITHLSNNASGNVKISKFDTLNKIISGSYDFKYWGTINNCDTTYISEGRFDLTF